MEERELLKQLAKDVKLSIDDEEMESLCSRYHAFIKQVESLENIQTEGVEPLVFPFDREITDLREDDIEEVESADDLLTNAKKTKNQQVLIPKVVES